MNGWQIGTLCTFTAGDEPTGNTRAELDIGILKNATRALLKSADLMMTDWPTALMQQKNDIEVKFAPWGSNYLGSFRMVRLADDWRHPMVRATALGPAEGLASRAGGYWVRTADGHQLRTAVAIRPKCSATVNNGPQEIAQPPQVPQIERDGQDAVERIQGGNPRNMAEQLKAAAEFWEVFDDIDQAPSEAGDGTPLEQAEDFEAKLQDHVLWLKSPLRMSSANASGSMENKLLQTSVVQFQELGGSAGVLQKGQ